MNRDEHLTLVPFRPDDQAAVKELIVSGLEEHWGWRDLSRNRDLDDIAMSYAGATFLVTWLGGTVVGTGALVPAGDGCARIVRMLVAAAYRKRGIGARILDELCRCAAQRGMRRVILETVSTWHDVVTFYTRRGFRITHEGEGDTHFELTLPCDHRDP